MRKTFLISICIIVAVAAHAQSSREVIDSNSKSRIEIKPAADTKGLKDYYKYYFPIGVAVSARALKTDEAQLILQQFNSITAENAMKMGPIHPRENEYNWKDADSIAAFARRHGLKLRGHTLC